jgi:hypothetical protein
MASPALYDPDGNPYPAMDMILMAPGVRVHCDDRDSPYWDHSGVVVRARPLAHGSWEFDVEFDGVRPRAQVTMRDQQLWPDSDQEKNAPPPEDALRIFLCHGKEDKEHARSLYRRLREAAYDPWLDEENLAPGVEWEPAIRAAVRGSDVVLVCLSRQSSSKVGFVQKEIRLALDAADERPEGLTYLIPIKLEDCDLPSRLQRWQAVDFYKAEGPHRLMDALKRHPRAGKGKGRRIYWSYGFR